MSQVNCLSRRSSDGVAVYLAALAFAIVWLRSFRACFPQPPFSMTPSAKSTVHRAIICSILRCHICWCGGFSLSDAQTVAFLAALSLSRRLLQGVFAQQMFCA
jgi:hypothetical protein